MTCIVVGCFEYSIEDSRFCDGHTSLVSTLSAAYHYYHDISDIYIQRGQHLQAADCLMNAIACRKECLQYYGKYTDEGHVKAIKDTQNLRRLLLKTHEREQTLLRWEEENLRWEAYWASYNAYVMCYC